MSSLLAFLPFFTVSGHNRMTFKHIVTQKRPVASRCFVSHCRTHWNARPLDSINRSVFLHCSFSSHATTIPVKTLTYHSVTPISSTHDTYQLSADHVSDADYEAVAKHVIEKRNANGVITTCTVPNTLAITFDDGPYRYTSELLDYLNEQDVKATFFMNGDNAGDVYEYDWVVKRAFNEGHQVASHTWSHPDLNKLSVEDIEHEMSRLDEAFKSVIGVRPVYMRPPYGNTNSVTRRTLCDMGYKIVTWSMDTNDWRHPDNVEASMKAYRSALSQPGAHKRGHIALQHDIHRTTALKLAPAAIKYAKEKGFNIVTVGECLGEPQSSWYRM